MEIETKYKINGKLYTKSNHLDCQLSSIESINFKNGELRIINGVLLYAKYTVSKLGYFKRYKIVSWCIQNLSDVEDRKNKVIQKFYDDLVKDSTNKCYDSFKRTYF
jgi:hypothetical protein